MKRRDRAPTRLLLAGLAAVAVAIVTLVAGGLILPARSIGGPQVAVADGNTCGKPIRDYEDLIASAPGEAFSIMTDNHYNQQLGIVFGDNEVLCGIVREAIDQAAARVVKIHVNRGTRVGWFWIKTGGQYLQEQYGPGSGGPTVLPDVGAGSGYVARVAWTDGDGVKLHSDPDHASQIGGIPEGASVTILCQQYGRHIDVTEGPAQSGRLWDKVEYNGQVGWVSDSYVNTGTTGQVTGSC